jgi:hypothetical protein
VARPSAFRRRIVVLSFMKVAVKANPMPAAAPSAAARAAGGTSRATRISPATAMIVAPAASSQDRASTAVLPARGAAVTRNRASPAVRTAVAVHERASSWMCNTRDIKIMVRGSSVMRKGWTRASPPSDRAVAWKTNPATSAPVPPSHTGR